MTTRGLEITASCLHRGLTGRYQIEAAISAVHMSAPSARETNWRRILNLYDQLVAVSDSPVTRLNRAVAVAEVEGPRRALDILEALTLENYYLWHVAKAEMYLQLGDRHRAAHELRTAGALTSNVAESRLIARRLAETSADVRSNVNRPAP